MFHHHLFKGGIQGVAGFATYIIGLAGLDVEFAFVSGRIGGLVVVACQVEALGLAVLAFAHLGIGHIAFEAHFKHVVGLCGILYIGGQRVVRPVLVLLVICAFAVDGHHKALLGGLDGSGYA